MPTGSSAARPAMRGITEMAKQDNPHRHHHLPRPRQWLWFLGLWAAGVAVTGAVGLVIKVWLSAH